MSRMLLAPGRYIQGAGAICEIGSHAEKLGTKALLCGGNTALEICGAAIETSLADAGLACHRAVFGGQCCDPEIDRLSAMARDNGCNLIIAAGGGKIIDTGKAVAHAIGAPVMIVPTIAATDAPCSALAVVYTPEGIFDRYLVLPANPSCVLVDTAIIAQAPARFLVAGMGDALATFWEADTCATSAKPNALTGATPPSLSAICLARLCYDILLEHGLMAKLAVERTVVTPALEAVVEANTLLSGLGFESGGLAGAHSVHNGLTVLEQCHDRLHGEKVAFGVLVQLVLEGRSRQDIDTVAEFCLSVGLPLCLGELGITQPTAQQIQAVASACCAAGETIHATAFTVTADAVAAAIWAADAIGRHYKQARCG